MVFDIVALFQIPAFLAFLWFGRNVIKEWVGRAIQHDFNTKLDVFRDELRQSELRVEAIRSSALAAVAQVRGATINRRLLAADQLWRGTRAAYQASGNIQTALLLNLPALAKQANEPRTQNLMEGLFKNAHDYLESRSKSDEGFEARPFVSALAWSLYSAYQAIVAAACLELALTKLGLDPSDIKSTYVQDLLKAALPDKVEAIEREGRSAHPKLVNELHDRLSVELYESIESPSVDLRHTEQAREILRIISALDAERGQQELPPGIPRAS